MTAVTVGDFEVADIAIDRTKVTRCTLQEEAGYTGGRFDDFTHCAGKIRANLIVFPGQRRWVAGVVRQDGPQAAIGLADTHYHDSVVCWSVWIVTTDPKVAFLVAKVTVRRQITASGGIRE